MIPTMYARSGEAIYLHGAPASRMLKTLAAGVEVSVAVTLLDGLVLARSVFHHSMNYRSVVVQGRATEVTDPEEKMFAFQALVGHVVTGRWGDARIPSDKELGATRVLKLPLAAVSAKLRGGGPKDDPGDLELQVWAGVIPLGVTPGAPIAAPDLIEGPGVPAYAAAYRRPGGLT